MRWDVPLSERLKGEGRREGGKEGRKYLRYWEYVSLHVILVVMFSSIQSLSGENYK